MRYLIILLALLSGSSATAQYHGGIDDGNSSSLVLGQNPLSGIYHGGQNDGFNQVLATAQNAINNIYTGGSNDGFVQAIANGQNALPNIFTGGQNDGFTLALASSQNSLNNIYAGGLNDGFTSILSASQNPINNIYTGGTNDGFNSSIMAGQNALNNIYTGGSNDGFSVITVASQNSSNPLALVLIAFTGDWQANDAALGWEVKQEHGIDHYELERSLNSTEFTSLGTVQPKNEDKNTSYSFIDFDAKYLPSDHVYYRLKSWYKDGGYEYSAIVRLSKRSAEPTLILYPNPTDGHFTLMFHQQSSLEACSYVILSQAGALVKRGSITDIKTDFDISNLAAGNYVMSVFKEGKTLQVFKIILTR